MKYCFGVDVGGTTIKMGLFSTNGEILDKWEIKTHTENSGASILPDIAGAVLKKIAEHKLSVSSVLGVGLGIPAPVDPEGVVMRTANLGWGRMEVKKELRELLGGMRVEAGNDANVAAMGEMWLGAGKGRKNVVMATLGTGVGGGIIIGGRMLVGENGAGGEIGHICVNHHETEACGCGLHGCLEQYASATGIRRLALRRLMRDDAPSILRNNKSVNAKTVFDAVKEGDPVAIEIAEEFGSYLGEGLASISAVVNPGVIVIGGGVSKAGEILLKFIDKPFREKAFFADKNIEIVLAELGNDAGICGAARLILD